MAINNWAHKASTVTTLWHCHHEILEWYSAAATPFSSPVVIKIAASVDWLNIIALIFAPFAIPISAMITQQPGLFMIHDVDMFGTVVNSFSKLACSSLLIIAFSLTSRTRERT